jgi:hypothetical protein
MEWNFRYILGLTQWDSSARYASDSYFGPMASLRQAWRDRFPGHEISSPGAHALYAGIVYMEAIKRAQVCDHFQPYVHLWRPSGRVPECYLPFWELLSVWSVAVLLNFSLW